MTAERRTGPDEKLQILLVETEARAGEIRTALERLGHEVVSTVANGAEAVREARGSRPDMVLLDVHLPGEDDGLEAGERISGELGLPVVFLSTDADPETLERVRHASSVGFVCRPFSDSSLRSTLELALYRHRMERRLGRSEERYRLLFERNVAGVLRESLEGRILECNPALASLLGYGAPEEVCGRESEELFVDPREAREHRKTLKEDGTVAGREIRLQARDGSVVWVVDNSSLFTDPHTGRTEVIRTVVDITERKEREQGLTRLAYHDALTGLPNRRLLTLRADQVLALAHRRRGHAALVFLDLVDFKTVNDRHGHRTGDDLLELVARRLESTLRSADTACRTGGDEFALLLAEVEDEEAALVVAERILERVAEPYELGELSLAVRARAGVALYPDHGHTLETLLARADAALTEAKKMGAEGVLPPPELGPMSGNGGPPEEGEAPDR